MPILDFKELDRTTPGEEFEGLVRELGAALGLQPEWTGRGADGGRDLTFTEARKGLVGSHDVKWLVSCKDFAQSGRAVSEADVGTVVEKLKQHGLQGFLLVTSTTASTGLKAMLDGLHEPGAVETQVWDRHELERRLLRDEHVDIVKRFMPSSYATWQRLGSLPLALEALDLLLPPLLAEQVRRSIEAFRVEDRWLTGSRVWPHDEISADAIDAALGALLGAGDAAEAARLLGEEEIEFDAFERLLSTLATVRREPARSLCRELAKLGNGDGISLFAYRFLVDHYAPGNAEMINLAAGLVAEDLHELFADEVAEFVGGSVASEPTAYRAWNALDLLSANTAIDAIDVHDIVLKGDPQASRIAFRADLEFHVTLNYGRDIHQATTFPGEVSGRIESDGIIVDDVTADTSGHYE